MSAENLILIIQIIYVVTALGAMVIIISENRNPMKTISWVLVLLLLPLVGLIFYYFLGEDNRKKRLISHKIFTKLKSPQEEEQEMAEVQIASKYKGLNRLLDVGEESPVYEGNSVRFFESGTEKFKTLFECIQQAKSHIHIQYYIYKDDKIGTELMNLLAEKAKAGVEVRLLYDDVGSWDVKRSFFKTAIKNGIQVVSFLKVHLRWIASRVNYRNHRKIVVIDGKIGFIGGMNVADRYIEGVSFGLWKDCHIMIEGSAVAGLQNSFLVDWYASRGEVLPREKYYPTLTNKGDNIIKIATSGPEGSFKTIHAGILQAINTAEKNIYIQTPYFIPTDALMLALQMAAIRGVDVRLMLPKHSDTKLVHIASMSFIQDTIDAGVSIYLYEVGFLHSKLIVVDDELTITGSSNMDIRSFEHNFEVNAFVYNEGTCLKAKSIFLEDVKSSELLDIEKWKNRGRIQKFKESVVRLLSPLL